MATFPKEFSHFLQTSGSHSKVHKENAKKKKFGIMKSGLDAMPLFLLDDLLSLQGDLGLGLRRNNGHMLNNSFKPLGLNRDFLID